MTPGREEALAALDRTRAAAKETDRQGSVVDRIVGSLSDQLETNGFSGRFAYLYRSTEDPKQ